MPYDSYGRYYDDGRPVSPADPIQPKRRQGMFSGTQMKATLVLIAANAVFFVITSLLPDRIYSSLALSTYSLRLGDWWTLVSSMFMHSGFSHIANNMISLLFVGAFLEPRIGTARFSAIYALSGIVGGIAFYFIHTVMGDHSLVVGASGAIFGLFGAYGYLILKNHLLHGRGDGTPITEIQVALFGFFLLENIVYGLADSSVANSAHLGGLVAGIILARALIPAEEI